MRAYRGFFGVWEGGLPLSPPFYFLPEPLYLVSVPDFARKVAHMISPDAFGLGLLLAGGLLLTAIFWLAFWAIARVWPIVSSLALSAYGGIRQNAYFTRLLARYPRFFAFLSKRLDRSRFYGLPLTLLGGAFVYFLFLYTGSTLDFVLADPLLRIDTRLANLFYAYRDPMLVQVFTVITDFGYSKVVIIIALGVTAILLLRRLPYFAFGLWLSLVGSEGMTWVLKKVFERPRSDLGVYLEHSNSFPSGHATGSVALYGFLAYILIRRGRHPLPVAALAVVIAFLIGLSRLYLVEHYLSDVLNGYLIGSVWLLLAIMVVEWLQERRPLAPHEPAPSTRWTVRGVALATAIATLTFIATYNQPLRERPAIAPQMLETTLEQAFSSGQMSPFTETILGTRQEPTSIIVFAPDDATFVSAFADAGWVLADRVGFTSFSEAIYAAWFNGEYPAAPVTPSFWMKTPNDFGFQKATSANTLRERHHARFWKTGYRTAEGLSIYVGTASFDDGLKWGITHHIDPNIDKERDVLIGDLAGAGVLSGQSSFQLIPAVLGQNFAGDPFFTDGKAMVLTIR